MDINIQKNSGLIRAISKKLDSEGYNTSKISFSIWSKVMEQVTAQNRQNLESGANAIYKGGSDLKGSGSKNFVVEEGKISFSETIWNNILALFTRKSDAKEIPLKPAVETRTGTEPSAVGTVDGSSEVAAPAQAETAASPAKGNPDIPKMPETMTGVGTVDGSSEVAAPAQAAAAASPAKGNPDIPKMPETMTGTEPSVVGTVDGSSEVAAPAQAAAAASPAKGNPDIPKMPETMTGTEPSVVGTVDGSSEVAAPAQAAAAASPAKGNPNIPKMSETVTVSADGKPKTINELNSVEEYLTSNTEVISFEDIKNKFFGGQEAEPEKNNDYLRFSKDGQYYSFLLDDKGKISQVCIAPVGTPDDGDWDRYLISDDKKALITPASFELCCAVNIAYPDIANQLRQTTDSKEIVKLALESDIRDLDIQMSTELKEAFFNNCYSTYKDDETGETEILAKFYNAVESDGVQKIMESVQTDDDQKVLVQLLNSGFESLDIIAIMKDSDAKNYIDTKIKQQSIYNLKEDKDFEPIKNRVERLVNLESALNANLGETNLSPDVQRVFKNNFSTTMQETQIPRFTKPAINEISRLVKTSQDEQVLIKLINSEFNADEIIGIMKNKAAKDYICSSENVPNKSDNNLAIFASKPKTSIDDKMLGEIKGYSSIDAPEIRENEAGRVFTIGDDSNKLYTYNGNRVEELKISRETFEKLFPPDIPYSKFEQGQTGDCYLISSLGTLMSNDVARTNIYKLFSEDDKGNVSITFPDKKPINFPNGELILDEDEINRVKTEIPAIQMLEEAYGKNVMDGMDQEELKKAIMHTKSDNEYNFKTEIFAAFGQGGSQEDVFKTILGENNCEVECVYDGTESEKLLENLNNFASNPNYMFLFSTPDICSDREYINKEYNLTGNHAYRIENYDKENGLISVVNPWNNSDVRTIPVYDFLNYIDAATIVNLGGKKDT